MSEAELHVLRARLRGGILNKARRGELETPLPIGFVYDGAKRVVLDPDQQVQSTVRTFFETFRRTGSATAIVKVFRQEQLGFPRRPRYGPRAGELLWAPLDHCGALRLLHNPRYAGTFFFGRTRTRAHAELGHIFERVPRAEWTALIPDAHVGYITGDEFEANQRRLRENAQAAGAERRRSPAREGPALLQGLVVCGVCGERMTVRYHQRHGALWPTYVCQRAGIARGEPICQGIPGRALDEAVGRLLMETVTPLTLEMTLAVQQELQARWDEADRLRHQQVDRARYEAELARRRYLRVDPDNRLVASELEAHWNQALRTLTEAQETYERQRQADRLDLDATQRARVLGLATDFPRLWAHPNTPDRERKRMIRLLIDDVTLLKTSDRLTAHVRFRGGTTTSLALPPALSAWQLRQTSPQVVALVDQLLDRYTQGEIARWLNAQGYCSGAGRAFHPRIVERIRRDYGLRPRYQRLREQGMLSLDEAARLLRIDPQTVKTWARHGLVAAHRYSDKHECLYEHPGEPLPVKMQGRRLSDRSRPRQPLVSNRSQEVQCGA